MATYSLTGSGVQTLTPGTGALYVSITTLPTAAGKGGANPDDYYGIGFIRPANAIAFWEPFSICGGPQWLPLPSGSTRFGYVLNGGAVASAVEVLGSSPLAFPLASLPDVALASVADAQVLAYQASSSKWINATPTGGGGGGTTVTYQTSTLGADVSIGSASTWVTGVSISLVAGTWFLMGQLSLYNNGSTTAGMCRLNAGATIYSALDGHNFGGETLPFSPSAVVVLASTTTVTLQAAIFVGTATIKASGWLLSQGNVYTRITGLKLA